MFLFCCLCRHLRKPLNLFISEAKNAQMDRLMEQRRSFGEAAGSKRLRTSRLVVKLCCKKQISFVDVQTCNNTFWYFHPRMATLISSRGTGSVELMEEPRQVQ